MDGMSPEYGMTDPRKKERGRNVPRHRACVHAWMGGIHNISELELDRKFGSRARVRGREGTRLGCYSVPCCCGRLPVLRRRVTGIVGDQFRGVRLGA